MPNYVFVSDLHGCVDRYERLFDCIQQEQPAAVFLGGDLLPSGLSALGSIKIMHCDFVNDFLVERFEQLMANMGERYPQVFLILGNDDSRSQEAALLAAATRRVWHYAHDRRFAFGRFNVYGYSFIPPSPFLNKDWERYDVSRYVEPGCVSPEEGHRSVPQSSSQIRFATISEDLSSLAGDRSLENAIFLFHAPPYQTNLDRAALDGKIIDHVPVDIHVGSIAMQRFILERQPLVTLHGHIHESARITGDWRDRIGNTHCFSAAHDGEELALVRFDPLDLESASRELIKVR